MDRPYIIMHLAASLDGRIAFAPGQSMFDQHPASDALPPGEASWKRVSEAIEAAWQPQGGMLGSGTVRREDEPVPKLPPYRGDPQALAQDYLPDEVVGQTRRWAILVDGRGRCRGGYKATEEPGRHILHLVSQAAPPEYLAFLQRERIPYLIGGERHVDLPEAMRKLREKLGLRAVVLGGGGTLNGAMLRAGLIDEVHLIVWPLLIGGDRTPTLADAPDLADGERPLRLSLVQAKPLPDGSLWLHYTVMR